MRAESFRPTRGQLWTIKETSILREAATDHKTSSVISRMLQELGFVRSPKACSNRANKLGLCLGDRLKSPPKRSRDPKPPQQPPPSERDVDGGEQNRFWQTAQRSDEAFRQVMERKMGILPSDPQSQPSTDRPRTIAAHVEPRSQGWTFDI